MNKIISRTVKHENNAIIGDDNRFKTEGNSEDQESATKYKNNWEDLLDKENSRDIHDFDGDVNENYGNSLKNIKNEEKVALYFESFFKKKDRQSLINKDFLDIFEEMDSESELFPEGDISEKYLYETLKVSSHQSSIPKTISTIMKKYATPTNRESQSLRFSFRNNKILSNILPPNNQIIIESPVILENPPFKHIKCITPTGQIPPKLNNNSFILDPDLSMVSEINISDQQMKKLIKYSMKKNTLLNKENIHYNFDSIIEEQPVERPKCEPKGVPAHKPTLVKHERIKSLDFLNTQTIKYEIGD